MSTVDFTFPCHFSVVTAPGGRQHTGRVVIEPDLAAEGATPAQVTHRLAEVVVNALRDDDGATLARRLLAVPRDAESELVTLWMPWRGRQVEARVRALRFGVAGHAFVCLPRLGATFAIPDGLGLEARNDQLQVAVSRWFRGDGYVEPEDAPEAEPWSERRGDRVLWIDVRARIPWELPSAEDFASILRALLGGGPMQGHAELRKVSRRLDALYPDRLLYDRVADPRVDTLRRLVFEDPEPVPTVLVGPSGSGKTTLVHAAVRRHLDHCFATDPKAARSQARLYHLDPNRVIAGMSVVGEWQRRLGAILTHLVDPKRERPRDALFVDQPLALARVGRSSGSALTLTTVLRPWIERRRVPLLLEATPEAWTRLVELDRAFADLFQVVRVDTPPWEDALLRVLANVEPVERSTGTEFEAAALRRLAELQRRFPAGRGLPGGLVDRLELLATRHAGATVHGSDVDATFGDVTGLRPELFDPDRLLLDAPLRERIAARLVGQPAAVDAIAEVVHVLRAGLARPGKPLAAWLLVGPTGVGKTEAAKVLAGLLFTDPERLVRLDMNEYVDGGAVTRLLGDAVTEGHLTARLRRHPVAVLLLDEIEKAHPAVADLLLQMLDEGRITDAAGRVVDLQRVAVILTSNVGASEVARGAGFEHARASATAAYRSAVERAFRPELVNRLDRVLVFTPLALPDIRRIARLQVDRILTREGFLRRTVLLDLHPDALDGLAAAGFDPALGARALKRVLEAALVGRVADQLAAAPPDRPLLLRVLPDGAGLRTDARLLAFAETASVRPAVPALGEAELLALRETLPDAELRAVAVPGGVLLEGGDVARLHGRIDAALEAFEEEPAEVYVEDRHLARIAARPRHYGERARRKMGWGGPVDWMEVVSFRSVREFLLDGAAHDRQDVEVSGDPLLALQVRAVRDGEAGACRLHVRGVVTDEPHVYDAFERYLTALREAIEAAGGRVTCWVRDERTWREHDYVRSGQAFGQQIWDVEGPAFARLLRAEEGVHLAWPADAPPVGLLLSVLPPGPPADLPRGEAGTVIRAMVAGGELRDLATGLATRAYPGFIVDLLPQVWAIRAGSAS